MPNQQAIFSVDRNYFEIFVRKGVVTQHRRFISEEVKKYRTLALDQNGAMRHVSFHFLSWFVYC